MLLQVEPQLIKSKQVVEHIGLVKVHIKQAKHILEVKHM